MKIKLLSIQSSKEKWFADARSLFEKKIKPMCSLELVDVKSKSLERAERQQKRSLESDLLLNKIKPTDYVILCDETGKSFSSLDFSAKIQEVFETTNPQMVFVIGGAYGVSDELKKRANMKWSLSKMVFNHHLAQVVVLEQIYRAFSIWKGLPYHNE